MIELLRLTFTRTIDLKRALAPLSSLAPTATLFYNDGAIYYLLATHPDRHLVAGLLILSHYICISATASISATAGLDIVKLYSFLNFSHDLYPVTIHARDNEDKFILEFWDPGITPCRGLTMGLIRPKAEHLIFVNQNWMYDVSIWMTSTNFRLIVVYLAEISPETVYVTITRDHVRLGATRVHFRLLRNQVWLFASYNAPPMLHCRVPPVGDITYTFL